MKKTRKALAVLLALTLLFSLCVTSAFAADAQKDGLKVTLTADKDEYKADDEIKVTAKVKNTNDSAVTDVTVKVSAPEGYEALNAEKSIKELKKDAELVVDTKLNAIVNETAAPAADAPDTQVNKEDKAPDTGDTSMTVFVVLFAFAIAGVVAAFALKSKKGKRIVSLALSLTLALSAFAMLASPALAADKDDKEIALEETVKIDGKDIAIKATVNYNFTKTEKAQLKLTASAAQVAIGEDEDNIVYFYAQGNKKFKDVKLYSAEKEIAKMLDDGKNGDKKANDGIFTAKAEIDNSAVKDFTFTAKAVTILNEKAVSEVLKITVFEPLKDQELKDMEDTDAEIEKLVDSEDFDKLGLDEKKEKAEKLLADQTKSGNIIADSVSYDEKNEMYTFEYGCGILGGIMLKDFEQNKELAPAKKDVKIANKVDFDLLNNADSSAVTNAIHSNAVIYYAFDPYYFSPRAPYYKKIQNEWPQIGINPKLDIRVTVRDLKSMNNYDIIVFSTHGTYFSNKDFQNPVICLRERAGFFKDLFYSADLKEHRIVKVNRQYWICPSFVDYYFQDGLKLQDKMVFSESCCFMGEYGHVDTSFADALINSGVPTVIGFHNSVYAVYSVDFMDLYIKTLAEGKSASSAFTAATDTFGINDYEWAVAHGIENARPENYAYPIIYGSPLETLKAFK